MPMPERFTKLEQIWATPVAQFDLASNPEAMARITLAAHRYHYGRAKRDAAFAQRTGRHIISRPDLLEGLTPEDRAWLADQASDAVREFLRTGLGDKLAAERTLAVRGFARAYEPGERIVPHTHFDCDVVVSIYLATGTEAADLLLLDPVVRGFPYRAPFHRIPVRPGLCIVFPAHVAHETDPSPEVRIIAGLEFKVIGHDMSKTFTTLEH